MKFALLAVIAAIYASPVEVEKRAWMTGTKIFTNGNSSPSTRVTKLFKIVLGTETAKQYRYRLRFTQLVGYANPTAIIMSALPNSNGVVRFYTTDTSEEWNAVGSTVVLDRIIPGSGVWQNEVTFNVACSSSGTVNNLAYAGDFTFTCTNQV